jgi:hypothetical protein
MLSYANRTSFEDANVTKQPSSFYSEGKGRRRKVHPVFATSGRRRVRSLSNPRKPYRKFGGKRYQVDLPHKDKPSAEQHAKVLRDAGFAVIVTKIGETWYTYYRQRAPKEKYPKIFVTDQYVRVRLKDPKKFKLIRTNDIGRPGHTKRLSGLNPETDKWETQGFIFEKDKLATDEKMQQMFNEVTGKTYGNWKSESETTEAETLTKIGGEAARQ